MKTTSTAYHPNNDAVTALTDALPAREAVSIVGETSRPFPQSGSRTPANAGQDEVVHPRLVYTAAGHSRAIVTMVVGSQYLDPWKRRCEANWRSYAQKYGYDLICIEQPLDTSPRARARSISWQKCLILGQEFCRRYDRIVWIDADILINIADAPDICDGVPLDKVGAAEQLGIPTPELYHEALRRYSESEGWTGYSSDIHRLGKLYYENMGLPAEFDGVLQCGVLVLSPVHHRELLERVYYNYEDKGARGYHMEQPALSYEALKADQVHWINSRFNNLWPFEEILNYPFLPELRKTSGFVSRVKQKLTKLLGLPSHLAIESACVTAGFSRSWFFHVSGSDTRIMDLVQLNLGSWRDSKL